MGVIGGLKDGDFKLQDGSGFNIKNDGANPVTLSVQLAAMKEGEFIETIFDTGWNPEIVKAIKKTGTDTGVTLKWGY
jgi:hypothetical protein